MSEFSFELVPQPGNPYKHYLIVYGVNPDATDPVHQRQSLARSASAYNYRVITPTCADVIFRL